MLKENFGYQAIPTKTAAMEAMHSYGQTLEHYGTGHTLSYDREKGCYLIGHQPVSEKQAQDFLSASLPGNLMAHAIVPSLKMPNLDGYEA